MICTPHQMVKSRQMMGGACGTCEEEDNWINNVGGETWRKETTWKTYARMGGYYSGRT
jgi:hypothetical protein